MYEAGLHNVLLGEMLPLGQPPKPQVSNGWNKCGQV